MHLLYKICRAENPEALHADFLVNASTEIRSFDEVQEEAVAKVKVILQEGGDVNNNDADGSTLLWKAAEEGHHNAVLELLQHPGVDPNKSQKNDSTTPLYISSYHGHEEVVKALLGHPRILVNKGKHSSGASPLFIAAQEGREGVVRALLQHPSVKVNQPNDEGTTPLSEACDQGHTPVVELLLRDSGLSEKGMNRSLLIAKQKRRDVIVRMLQRRMATGPETAYLC